MASLIPKQEKLIITDTWAAQTWKVALLSSSFTYNHATHTTYTSVSGNEATGTGYVAGGNTLAGKVSGYVDTTTTYLDATDLSWGPGVTLTNVRYAACYDTATGLIRAIFDFGSAYSCTNATFTIQWHSSGLTRIA
jgi:hypothetical protein